MSIGNVIIGQSGGPTSVINASLAGVYKAARDNGAKKIYGMLNGVEGLIEGRYVNLSDHIKTDMDIELLKRTPASFLGTCRYKLKDVKTKEEDYVKIFAHLKKLNVKAVFYAGGNDSMDSINKLADYAKASNIDVRVIGVPKTIDNDLEVTDHTPGYGSAAKYIASAMKEIILDASAYNQKSVVMVEIMGRNAGWLTAASVLAKGVDNHGPDLVLVPEITFNEENFLKRLSDMILTKKTLVVALSEGLRDENGVAVGSKETGPVDKDAFGNEALSGSAYYLRRLITRELGIKRTRSIELSSIQRCAAHISSRTDVDEAFLAGAYAVKAAVAGETAHMVVFKRVSNEPYSITLSTSHVSEIANAEKKLPLEWIDSQGCQIRKDFVEYARPLIMGEMPPIMIDGVPHHFVMGSR